MNFAHKHQLWRIRLSALVIILLLSLSQGTVTGLAQDSTDEAPPAEIQAHEPEQAAVETPTEGQVEEPTTEAPTEAAAEPLPTGEAAVEATTEPPPTEAAPTDEATQTPTPIITAIPLLDEPALTTLYSDSFDGGDLSMWRLGAGWGLAPSKGGQAMQIVSATGAFQFILTPLEDVAIQARFLLAGGTAQLLVRQSEQGAYSASLTADGAVELARNGEALQTAQLTLDESSQWRTLRLSAMGGVLRVSVDGTQVIGMIDENPLPAGAASVAAVIDDPVGLAQVDDVMLWLAEGETPPTLPEPVVEATVEPQVSVEITPEAAPEATEEATRIIIVPEIVTLEAPPVVRAGGPAAPALSSPSNNAVTTDTTPSFGWGSSSEATLYRLEIFSEEPGDPPPLAVFAIDRTTRSYTLLSGEALAQGMYWWRVTACDSTLACGEPSAARKFTVFLGKSPGNGAFTTDTTPTFSWAGIGGTSKYWFELAQETDFDPLLAGYPLDRGTSTSYTPGTPLPPGTYYWRVRREGETFANAVYRTLFIGVAPAAPGLSQPANDAYLPTLTPNLLWSGVTPPTGVVLAGYEIQLASNSAFTSNVQSLIDDTTPGMTPMLTEGKKYWRVRALFDVNSPGKWSSSRSFTLDVTDPGAAPLVAPTNNATTTNTKPTFHWNSAPGASRYEVLLDTVNPPLNVMVNTGSTSFTPPAPLLYTTFDGIGGVAYYWQVRAIDKAGNDSFSEIRTLEIDASSSAVPTLNRMASGFVTLTWTPISWATMYQLQIDTSSSFSSPLVYERVTIASTNTSHTTEVRLPEGTYFWRVRARKANNTSWGAWSSTGRFTVDE